MGGGQGESREVETVEKVQAILTLHYMLLLAPSLFGNWHQWKELTLYLLLSVVPSSLTEAAHDYSFCGANQHCVCGTLLCLTSQHYMYRLRFL